MPEMRTIMMWMIPLMIAITVLSQVLLGGLVGVVASSAQKQDVKASHIFRAFASERIFKLMGLLALTLFSWVCTYIIYYVFGGPEYLSELIEMIQNIQPGVPPVEPEAAHPILMNLASWLVGLVIGFVTLLSVPAVMLRGQLPLEAIAVGFRAVLKNAAAFAFMTLVFIVAMIVLVIVMFVVALILGVIAAVLPIIGVPIIFAVLFTLFVVSMLLWSAVAYFAWQDILGDQQDTAADATSNEVAL